MDTNELGEKLKELLKLENEPVAIKWSVREPADIERENGKSRFCEKLVKAMNGEVFYATRDEEECMGGARYTGLRDPSEFPANMRSGAFLVPMGVYRNIPAVQRSWRGNLNIEAGIFRALIFAPLNLLNTSPTSYSSSAMPGRQWRSSMPTPMTQVHMALGPTQDPYAVQWQHSPTSQVR